MDCDQSILGTINASLKDANVNMRRAVGNIVDDVNAKRMQANINLAKLTSMVRLQPSPGLPRKSSNQQDFQISFRLDTSRDV